MGNQIMTAEMFDRLEGGAGTANDQVAAVAVIRNLRLALNKISRVEPTPGKAAKNRGTMLQMQAIAKQALDPI